MSQEFSCPEFDEHGVKILSTAGDAENDMMMNINVLMNLIIIVRYYGYLLRKKMLMFMLVI